MWSFFFFSQGVFCEGGDEKGLVVFGCVILEDCLDVCNSFWFGAIGLFL